MSRAAVGRRLEGERRRDDVDHSRALRPHDRAPGAPRMDGRPRAADEGPGRELMRTALGYIVGLERGAAGGLPAEPSAPTTASYEATSERFGDTDRTRNHRILVVDDEPAS